MKIPFSSSLPDAVQKILGQNGSAGKVEEIFLGAAACLVVSWGLLKLTKKLGSGKKP